MEKKSFFITWWEEFLGFYYFLIGLALVNLSPLLLEFIQMSKQANINITINSWRVLIVVIRFGSVNIAFPGQAAAVYLEV